MAKVIAIHSYRGGTGKSHFTANLAVALAQQGRRVGVVDTDLPSPGIHNLLLLQPEGIRHVLNDFLWGECRIEEAAHEVTERIGLQGGGRLWLVPASIDAEDIARILKDSYDVRRLNDGLREFATTHELDYLLIDTHPGLSKETFLSVALSHLAILVLRPDKQDYQGTAVILDVARRLKVRNIVLTVNKAHARIDQEALKQEVERTYEVPVLGVFPLSEDVARLASDGVFSLRYPDHPISLKLEQMARQVAAIP